MTKNDPPLREVAEGEQEMTKISGNDEKEREITRNIRKCDFGLSHKDAVIGIIVTDGIFWCRQALWTG